MLLIGAEAMLAGRFSVGDFVLFTIYLEWMLELPRRLGRLLSQQQTSKKSIFTPDTEKLDSGLETRIGSPGVLSGGQLQRVSAARAYIRRPELYVIDDITSALDHHTQQAIWREIIASRCQAEGTYLIVSNHPIAIDQSDQVLNIRHGRITTN